MFVCRSSLPEHFPLITTIPSPASYTATMSMGSEKAFHAPRPPCALRSQPEDFPSTYEQQVNENLRHFAQAATSRQGFYPIEHGMTRKKQFNRRRFQVIVCIVLILVAFGTILAAVGTSTGFLSGTGSDQVSVPRLNF